MPYHTGSATDYVDLLNQLIEFATADGLQSVDSIDSAGTGYVVGEVLTDDGDGTFAYPFTLRVTQVGGGGEVEAVEIVEAGAYSVASSDPVPTTSDGSGTGAEFLCTFGSNGWTMQRRSQEAVSATVDAGGTGNAIGDILTVPGGTLTTASKWRVTAVTAGAVDTVELLRRGHYLFPPSNPAATTTDGGGSGCTLNVTYQPVEYNAHQEALTATKVSGGSSYSVGDEVTGVGGTGTAFILRVLTAPAGVIGTVKVVRGGDYTSMPANPVSVTGGGGSGATFTVAYQNLQPDFHVEAILEGEGGGSDEIFVGVRTTDDLSGSGAANWELAGMTGYNAASSYGTQPGISPGRWETPDKGAYVPLSVGSTTFWFFVDGFRMVCVFKIGSTYLNMYLGFINPAATEAQYPYPLLAEGCSSLWNQLYSAAITNMSGLVDPVSDTTTAAGPGLLRSPGGTWLPLVNSGGAGGARSKRQKCVVYPCGSPSLSGLPAKDVASASPNWDVFDVVPSEGSPGTSTLVVMQTPGSELSVLFPTVIIEADPDIQVLGELRGVRWVSAKGNTSNVTPEDTMTIGDEVWLAFQNCNRTDLHAYYAIQQR